MYRWIFAFSCGIALPALAQDGPSFDCAKAATDAERLVCSDSEIAALDRQVADRYGAALEVIEDMDAGTTEAEAELRRVQRGWLGARDACTETEDPASCVTSSYLRRDAELASTWFLDQPIRTVGWACDGNPANEVVTIFFDTTLPSLRFERGDSIDTGTLSRTASGSRYDGSFGRYIWIKGDEATYRDPIRMGPHITASAAWEE